MKREKKLPSIWVVISSMLVVVLYACGTIQTEHPNAEYTMSGSSDNTSTFELVFFPSYPNGFTAESVRKQSELDTERWLSKKEGPKARLAHFVLTVVPKASWSETHRESQNLMQNFEREKIGFFYQQQLAASILRSYCISMNPTLDVQKATEYYLEFLRRFNSYGDINLFARSLLVLQSYWSPEKIANVADEVLKSHQKHSGNKFSAETFFQQRLKTFNGTSGHSVASDQKSLQKIRQEFKNDLPEYLKKRDYVWKYSEGGKKEFNPMPHIESLVALSLLAEKQNQK